MTEPAQFQSSSGRLHVGMTARSVRTITREDVALFARASGDCNPLHLDEDFARTTIFRSPIAHGMLTAGLVSALIASDLPGPGAIYRSQTLHFVAPVRPGDVVTTQATLVGMDEARRQLCLDTRCFVGEQLVLHGEAVVQLPRGWTPGASPPRR
jgi:3-hydroxybutyryl-CoA dehydratase